MKTLELISPSERRFTPAILLSPSQRKAAEGVLLGLERGDCVVLRALASASAARKKMLFATGEIPDPLLRRAHSWFIEDFTGTDFETICSAYLDPAVCRRLDFAELHRYAPSLNAHQLRRAAVWLSHEP